LSTLGSTALHRATAVQRRFHRRSVAPLRRCRSPPRATAPRSGPPVLARGTQPGVGSPAPR